MRIDMTEAQAEMLGIIKCSNCGMPPNNHFDGGKGACAHNKECRKFKRVIVLPKDEDD